MSKVVGLLLTTDVGDVYAQVLVDNVPVREKLVRRYKRPQRAVELEATVLLHKLFAKELELRAQLSLPGMDVPPRTPRTIRPKRGRHMRKF